MKAYEVLLIIFFLGGIITLFRPKYEPVRERFSVFFWTNAILGLILFFFRYQDIPLLGMDFFRFTLEVTAAIWLFFITRFSLQVYPQKKLEDQIAERKNKYLPKAKN